jgi:photosystem II stability/assembly factor-like uncharacterized protein
MIPRKTTTHFASCAAFAMAASAALMAGDATELGPAPIVNGGYVGRVSSLICSPTDPRRYFVGAADGGVWRTLDGGASWTPLTDQMPTTAIGALAFDPTNEQVIYAGTGEANYANHSRYGLGLYKSADGGDTWQHLGESVFAGRCFSKIVVSHQDSQVLYASITRAGGFPELAAAKGHPQATGPLGVFRSNDGGVSWTHLTAGIPGDLSATDLAIDPTDGQVVYAAVGRIFGHAGNGIYKTVDGGVSWTKLTNGLPASWQDQGRIALGLAPTMPNRVYTLIAAKSDAAGGGAATRGAFRTDDGGATWAPLANLNIQATYGWYLCVAAVRPDDPDTVVFGGLTMVRSRNAGAAFQSITPPHVDIHAIAWDANGRLVAGDDGGFHRSPNDGVNWVTRNEGLGTIQFYAGLSTHPTDDRVVFGGAQDNGSNRRTTSDKTWAQVFGGDGGWTQLNPTAPDVVFVEFQGTGNLYRSSDGGNGFTQSATGIVAQDRNCFLPPYVIDPLNPNRMLYGTHRIYESLDGGMSWTRIGTNVTNGPPAAIRALAIAPTNSSVVYAATNDGNILISLDGGVTSEVILSGVPGWPRVTREIVVDPTDAMTMYLAVAAFGQTQVRRTTDGGKTWEALDAGLPDIPVNVVAVDPRPTRNVIYAGSDNGLYRSIDDGLSWHRYGHGLPYAAVIDLVFEPQRRRAIVGTQGRGAWSVQASAPGDVDFDGDVDISDLGWLLSEFGCQDGSCVADVDGDGATGLGDLEVLLLEFGFGA